MSPMNPIDLQYCTSVGVIDPVECQQLMGPADPNAPTPGMVPVGDVGGAGTGIAASSPSPQYTPVEYDSGMGAGGSIAPVSDVPVARPVVRPEGASFLGQTGATGATGGVGIPGGTGVNLEINRLLDQHRANLAAEAAGQPAQSVTPFTPAATDRGASPVAGMVLGPDGIYHPAPTGGVGAVGAESVAPTPPALTERAPSNVNVAGFTLGPDGIYHPTAPDDPTGLAAPPVNRGTTGVDTGGFNPGPNVGDTSGDSDQVYSEGNELLSQYIYENPDSWLHGANIAPGMLSQLDPVGDSATYARQYARGVGQDSTYAAIIDPIVQRAPGMLALMGQEGHDPLSLAEGIDPFIQQQMGAGDGPNQYIDTQGLLDNMFTSGDLSAWGLSETATGMEQYETIQGAANAAAGGLTGSGQKYLETLMNDALASWQDRIVQGDTISFTDHLREIGASDWF